MKLTTRPMQLTPLPNRKRRNDLTGIFHCSFKRPAHGLSLHFAPTVLLLLSTKCVVSSIKGTYHGNNYIFTPNDYQFLH